MGEDTRAGGGVSAETLELLERRLTERIVNGVQPRLFKFYAALGGAVIAVLGFVGFNLYSEIKAAAAQYAQAQTEEPVKAARDAELKVDLEFSLLDKLVARSQATFDKVDQKLADFQPKAQKLTDIETQIDDISNRFREAAGDVDPSQNAALIGQLGEQVASLAKQVDELSSYVKPAAAGAGTGAPAPVAIGHAAQSVATSSSNLTQQISKDAQQKIVFVQFYGIARDKAEQLADQLRTAYRVPGIEFTPAANSGKFEVRYFYDTEKDAATALAAAASEAAKSILNDDRAAQLQPMLNFAGRKPKRGVLELWYSPAS